MLTVNVLLIILTTIVCTSKFEDWALDDHFYVDLFMFVMEIWERCVFRGTNTYVYALFCYFKYITVLIINQLYYCCKLLVVECLLYLYEMLYMHWVLPGLLTDWRIAAECSEDTYSLFHSFFSALTDPSWHKFHEVKKLVDSSSILLNLVAALLVGHWI